MKITFKQYVLNYQVDFDVTLLELSVLAGNLNKIAPNPNSRINFQIAILIYSKLKWQFSLQNMGCTFYIFRKMHLYPCVYLHFWWNNIWYHLMHTCYKIYSYFEFQFFTYHLPSVVHSATLIMVSPRKGREASIDVNMVGGKFPRHLKFLFNPFPHTAILQQTTFRRILNIHSAKRNEHFF